MGDVSLRHPAALDADHASSRWNSVSWPAAAAFAAFTVSFVAVDGFHASREAFVLPYVVVAGVLTTMFVRKERIDLALEVRRHPMRAIVMTALAAALSIATVLAQPGAPRAHGARLAFEIVWDGLAYGAVDGTLLTVIPIAGVRRALGAGWKTETLALLASIVVFVVYHLGFPELRNATLVGPIVSGVIFGAAYLVTRNPLVPIAAHAAMHVMAVLHGPAGTLQLPPH